MTHYHRHPEVRAQSASHRKWALADLRTHDPISGKPEIEGATAQMPPRIRGRSSFEARTAAKRLRCSHLRMTVIG